MIYKVIPIAFLFLSFNVSAENMALDSREYKILLNIDLFTGDAASRLKKVNVYWSTLKNVIEKGALKGRTSEYLSLDKQREVSFYDTQGSCTLFNAGYSFRERVEKGKRKVTLKFRSLDPFLANTKDLRGAKSKAKHKFEEDVAVPLISTYSSSTTQKIGNTKNLNKMDDPIGLYPGLKGESFNENLALEKVGNLTVSEYVYKNATVDLGVVSTEFSLTLWYSESINTTQPIIAEISFKQVNDKQGFHSSEVKRTEELFIAMQENPLLSHWNATETLTKTATIYQYENGFCD